jgi:exonuclease SbcC
MIPIKLTLENFVSHTKSILDFTQFDVALVVGMIDENLNMANGAGKSSVFEAIFWALYGKTRFSAKERVVKRGKSVCFVEFIFSLSGDLYKVTRKLNKRSNTVEVGLYKKEGNVWSSEGYICDTPTLTNKKIEEIIGMSYETGINSIYFKQNDIFGFAGSKATNKKDILKEVLQIGIWDEFQKSANKSEKKLSEQKSILSGRLEQFKNLDEEKKNNKDKINKIEENINNIKKEISISEENLRFCKEKLTQLELAMFNSNTTNKTNMEIRLQEISNEGKRICNYKDKLREEANSNNSLLLKFSDTIKQLKEKQFELSKDVLVVSHASRNKAKKIFMEFSSNDIPSVVYDAEKIDEKVNKREEHERNINDIKLQLSQLISLRPGNECPICLSNITDLKGVSFKRKERENSLRLKMVEEEKIVKELSSSIMDDSKFIKKAESSFMEMERIEISLEKSYANIDSCSRRNEEIQTELKKLAGEWQRLKSEKEQIVKLINISGDDYYSEFKSLQEQKIILEKDIEKLRIKLMEFSVERGNIVGYLEELERRFSEREVLIEESDKINDSVKVYEKLAKAFGKDGIQSIIIENVTEDLKNYTNSILQKICNDQMSVNFVTQRQTTTGGWKEDFDLQIITKESTLDFDDLSGGEQVRISIAMRLAISQLLMNRIGSNIKFLLLDEVDQALDRQGLEALIETIEILSKEFKILLITHNEFVKERFEHIITVQKTSSGSVLRQ